MKKLKHGCVLLLFFQPASKIVSGTLVQIKGSHLEKWRNYNISILYNMYYRNLGHDCTSPNSESIKTTSRALLGTRGGHTYSRILRILISGYCKKVLKLMIVRFDY